MEFEVFHKYNRLVRRGQAPRLTHSCGKEFFLQLGKDDEPALYCAWCNIVSSPNLSVYREIEKTVQEHFGVS